MDKIIVVASGEYRQTVEALKNDPIILRMAKGVEHVTLEEMDTYAFMAAASRTYHEHGGQVPTHIGGPQEALMALRKGL